MGLYLRIKGMRGSTLRSSDDEECGAFEENDFRCVAGVGEGR